MKVHCSSQLQEYIPNSSFFVKNILIYTGFKPNLHQNTGNSSIHKTCPKRYNIRRNICRVAAVQIYELGLLNCAKHGIIILN